MTSFDVVSIRASAPAVQGRGMRSGSRGGPGSKDPTRFTAENVTLTFLITLAYNLKFWEFSGPAWLRTFQAPRFDISANIPEGATQDQFRLMLQNMLIERFKLTVHREAREIQIYELSIAKNGPKLKESAADPPRSTAPSPRRGPAKLGPDGFPELGPGETMALIGNRARRRESNQSMADLVTILSLDMDSPVHDATGLTGKYDIELHWVHQDDMRAPPPPQLQHGGTIHSDPDAPFGPNVFEALKTQLGLKLEQKKGKADVLVVDSLSKIPTEN
ncbi:MAG TPA: TIGR03435 family protein [Bryobacteraceae bacterium]|jgi:uncharacterized protein (TIGR03435 family)